MLARLGFALVLVDLGCLGFAADLGRTSGSTLPVAIFNSTRVAVPVIWVSARSTSALNRAV